jgi:hypothetical protein
MIGCHGPDAKKYLGQVRMRVGHVQPSTEGTTVVDQMTQKMNRFKKPRRPFVGSFIISAAFSKFGAEIQNANVDRRARERTQS